MGCGNLAVIQEVDEPTELTKTSRSSSETLLLFCAAGGSSSARWSLGEPSIGGEQRAQTYELVGDAGRAVDHGDGAGLLELQDRVLLKVLRPADTSEPLKHKDSTVLTAQDVEVLGVRRAADECAKGVSRYLTGVRLGLSLTDSLEVGKPPLLEPGHTEEDLLYAANL